MDTEIRVEEINVSAHVGVSPHTAGARTIGHHDDNLDDSEKHDTERSGRLAKGDVEVLFRSTPPAQKPQTISLLFARLKATCRFSEIAPGLLVFSLGFRRVVAKRAMRDIRERKFHFLPALWSIAYGWR